MSCRVWLHLACMVLSFCLLMVADAPVFVVLMAGAASWFMFPLFDLEWFKRANLVFILAAFPLSLGLAGGDALLDEASRFGWVALGAFCSGAFRLLAERWGWVRGIRG